MNANPVTLSEHRDAADIALEKALAAAAADIAAGKVDGPTEFAITTEDQALWAARKLREAKAEVDERLELAGREMRRIREWCDAANASALSTIEKFEVLLEGYHRHVLAEDAKRKTVKLPGVTLKARKQPEQWAFDDAAFVAWAKTAAPDLVRVKEEPNRSDAKSALKVVEGMAITEDGEAADGVTVTPGAVSFSIVTEAGQG